MKLESKPFNYKKTDGIYSKEDKLNKWQKFLLNFGIFLGKGAAGRWEINFKIKF